MVYTQTTWLLFFFFYCFIGWVWESCFVSFQKKRWVNRGFLHGPFLPIYGFGAVIVLLLTLPVRDNLILIYLVGMVGATLLEYITGMLMERLFHMRYWDYSNMRFHLHGYICLACSLGWGVFSVLMVRVVHPPVDRLFARIPEYIADPVSLILVCIFAVDTALSVQTALDVKDLLAKLSENRHTFSRVEARLENARSALAQKHLLLHEKAAAVISDLSEQLQRASLPQEQSRLKTILEEMQRIQQQWREMELDRTSRRNRDYRRMLSILRRNPGAVSSRYKEILNELKQIGSKKD